jgi:hypothetical protein
MYSYPAFSDASGWPFQGASGRSRPTKASRQSPYDYYAPSQGGFNEPEDLYAEQRLHAARELEKQRLAQEYAVCVHFYFLHFFNNSLFFILGFNLRISVYLYTHHLTNYLTYIFP